MPTKHGAYSGDFDDGRVTNLDDNAYYPGRTPNKYVSNAKGTNKIDLSKQLDGNFYDSIGTEGEGLNGGFSNWVSRSRNHPK
jgi:hypothetical protein